MKLFGSEELMNSGGCCYFCLRRTELLLVLIQPSTNQLLSL